MAHQHDTMALSYLPSQGLWITNPWTLHPLLLRLPSAGSGHCLIALCLFGHIRFPGSLKCRLLKDMNTTFYFLVFTTMPNTILTKMLHKFLLSWAKTTFHGNKMMELNIFRVLLILHHSLGWWPVVVQASGTYRLGPDHYHRLPPGHSLALHCLLSHPRHVESETLGVESHKLCSNQPPSGPSAASIFKTLLWAQLTLHTAQQNTN